MRREEARKSEESSKEKKEPRRIGENGEGWGIFIEVESGWRHHEGGAHSLVLWVGLNKIQNA